jgi:hypothetical protein
MEEQKFGNSREGQKTLLDNITSGVSLIFAINTDISYVSVYLTKIKFLHDIKCNIFHYFS